MRNLILLIAITIVFTACTKESGEGGTSVIQGQVYKIFTSEIVVDELDSLGNLVSYKTIDTLYFQLNAGEDVFIIYSDDETAIYDDKFETDYNGRYSFEFLRKGDYTLYTYADSTVDVTANISVKYEYPVFKHFKISSNNSENFIDNFVIEENQ